MPAWKERIERAIERSADPVEYTYGEPAPAARLLALEEKFGTLPTDLRSLLEETDGVVDKHSDPVIWNADEIDARNDDLRNNVDEDEPLPYDHFLFFADNGIGDSFGICLKVPAEETPQRSSCPGDIPGPIGLGDVIVWMHEDDTRVRFAPGLSDFIDGWFSGERAT